MQQDTINLNGAWTSVADASKGLMALGSGFQSAEQACANLHAALSRFADPCSAMNKQRLAAIRVGISVSTKPVIGHSK